MLHRPAPAPEAVTRGIARLRSAARERDAAAETGAADRSREVLVYVRTGQFPVGPEARQAVEDALVAASDCRHEAGDRRAAARVVEQAQVEEAGGYVRCHRRGGGGPAPAA